MKTNLEKINTDVCYQEAEQKAADYFQSLHTQLLQKEDIPTLITDIELWRKNHRRHLFSIKSRKKPDPKDYRKYIQWLHYTNKLESYLKRSFSYIFMRDLGKDIRDKETKEKLDKMVADVKNHLADSTTKGNKEHTDTLNMASLYRLAEKEGVELTMIWVMNKIKTVSANIPEELEPEHAKRKLIKLIAGVVMQEVEEMGKDVASEERKERLDKAIRLGYAYGLTYPFIDDLLDAKLLSNEEEKQYSDLIRTTLTTGIVPDLENWTGENQKLIYYIHSELKEAFEYIKANQKPDNMTSFLEQSYIFFQSQEVDRWKDLSNPNYTNEEIYIPIILKSSSSRLIVRSVISAAHDDEVNDRLFFYGIYNQLADDFTDMFDDMAEESVTPYTYYWKYHDRRPDLVNPFELYWTVIHHLIHHVYYSDPMVCEMIFSRAINSLKRFKERWGRDKYNQVMELYASGIPELNKVIQEAVRKAENVDFFDKLLRDHIISSLKKEQEEQEDFIDTVREIRNRINTVLPILEKDNQLLKNPIIDGANYSLAGEGKRLRPVITWFMAVKQYGLEESAILPLLKSLEYMHTASLIFDDLPSQDNASVRRGRRTLHQVYSTAVAELTGLFLTQKGMEEQASMDQFEAKTVLQLIRYSAQKTEEMCQGQAMDLESKGKVLSLEQLNTLCFYKTGIAFEASLIMPAMLANVSEREIKALKKFAYHAGIAFQIKDDLLDVEGKEEVIGKTIGQDLVNKTATFVSVLGQDGAKRAMWEHFCLASETLEELTSPIPFLKHLLNYIVHREN
ncbi:polyprenyl synthetase family protein [Oceanobacillus halophilus]|uniref:Polyprenyl synthetase family protein n=1 Tax=Oceanobacillus halophilus TaxID=930130 RepID=A0A495A668_9BACI|nr:polyprenyl synthetase family protein [Oceanobacillus halophilus]RKQ34664.1 polyprenyl synthetase family protein [Oceanobacillus halophilus]